MANNDIFGTLRNEFAAIVNDHGLADKAVSITARPLTPNEVIGNPEDDDYPLVKGRERMMEADFLGAKGQAFTDMFGEWKGSVSDVVRMDLANNFRRAVFVSSLNAVMQHVELIEATAHCKDDGPVRCGEECLNMLAREFSTSSRVLLIGHQPRLLEHVSKRFTLNAVDMDENNIGRDFFGIMIQRPEATGRLAEEADVVLVTGTTLVNDTISQFLERNTPTIFYGITIAGAAKILGLRRFCPFGL